MSVITGTPLVPDILNTSGLSAELASATAVTAAMTDLATINLTTIYPNAIFLAVWTMDFSWIQAASGTPAVAVGQISIDGVDLGDPQAIWCAANIAATGRATVSQSYFGTFAAAGAHSVKLQTAQSLAPGTTNGQYRANAVHTRLSLLVFP